MFKYKVNMKVISEMELAQLLRDSYKLYCLESAGVENWEAYESSLNDIDEADPDPFLTYSEYKKLSDSELTKFYKNA